MKKSGTMPGHMIQDMVDGGFIKGTRPKNVRIASLDLELSPEIYRVDGIFLPMHGEKIRDILSIIGISKYNPNFPLERNVSYLAKLEESLKLPEEIYGYCNPKSSTGRNDLHVRIMADGVSRYDAVIPGGYAGELWIIIEPRSFPIKVVPGISLSQIRFFNEDTRFTETELQIAFERDKLLWHRGNALSYDEIKVRDNDGSLILTIELGSGLIGYECRGSNRVMDFSRANYYQPSDFFSAISASSGMLALKKDSFYILWTREAIRVPPHLSCEVIPMDERSGEFRSHYAGFFDPGWGWGEKGEGKGRRAVLEIRPFSDLLLRDNQPVAKFRFERMIEIPEANYDSLPDSSYKEEGILPRLSRHFKEATCK